jgi:hypothetical protein
LPRRFLNVAARRSCRVSNTSVLNVGVWTDSAYSTVHAALGLKG